MIIVTRLGGLPFAVNPDLIERAECSPDTVVTLVDGTKYVIAESVPELIELVRTYRASVIATASALEHEARERKPAAEPGPGRRRTAEGTVVPLPQRER
jgi:flagellar protein FlbD